jgi:toxin ParE1/3/4
MSPTTRPGARGKSRLRRTARAEEDLIEIWTYIARDSPRAADRLLDRLDRKSMMLAQNPRVGMARDDIAEGVRHFPVGNYLILYRLLKDGVEIVRYAHGRRRLRDLI